MIKIKKKDFNELFLLACDSWKKKFKQKFEDFIFSDELEFEENFLEEMEKACTDVQLPIFKKIFKSYIKEDLFSQVKNYSDVCKKLKIIELTEKDFKQFGEDSNKLLAFHKLKNIEKLFNQEWVVDFKNASQYKYYPYFTYNNGSWGFYGSYYYYYCYYGCAALFKDKKTSDFVGKTFLDLYKNII